MRRTLGIGLVLVLAVAGDAVVRADAYVPPAPCPATPHDGIGCSSHRPGTACRYPGVVCECRRVMVDGRARRRWVCGESGE